MTGGSEFGVLVFDPRRYVRWWPAHNFSEYKTSIVGRHSRAIAVAAYDVGRAAGFRLTVAPNTQRGIQTEPYDAAELLVE